LPKLNGDDHNHNDNDNHNRNNNNNNNHNEKDIQNHNNNNDNDNNNESSAAVSSPRDFCAQFLKLLKRDAAKGRSGDGECPLRARPHEGRRQRDRMRQRDWATADPIAADGDG
jgi:hypothetical protein